MTLINGIVWERPNQIALMQCFLCRRSDAKHIISPFPSGPRLSLPHTVCQTISLYRRAEREIWEIWSCLSVWSKCHRPDLLSLMRQDLYTVPHMQQSVSSRTGLIKALSQALFWYRYSLSWFITDVMWKMYKDVIFFMSFECIQTLQLSFQLLHINLCHLHGHLKNSVKDKVYYHLLDIHHYCKALF